ncbi:MAG: restriction endonuclease subunit S [Bacteroidales bacterium]|nr:restriction endonuclease subunit S [Bacteroidales bacterium]
MSKNNNIPRLRFPEFTGEWEEKRLEDVFEFRNGYTPSKTNLKYWNGGNIPWFKLEDIREKGNILNNSNLHITNHAVKGGGLFKANSIIVATSATIGEHALIKVAHLANQRFTNLYPKSNFVNLIDMMYAFYYMFIVDEICKTILNIGNFASVNMSSFSRIPFLIPSLPEQQKIASCLTEMDNLISAQGQRVEALKEKKKGLMQQLFPQNGETTPRLRFPGFDGEWGKKPLSYFLFEHKTKSDGKCEVHSVSVSKGVINQLVYLGRSFAAADTSKYNLAKPNDIIYTKSPTGDFPYGIVKMNKNPYNVIVSPLYAVYSPINKYIGYILDSYFESSANTNNYLSSLIQKGAKNTIQISNTTFVSKSICLPENPSEQKAIAECLSELDNLIAAESDKLENLKKYKKGLMQQLFPQPVK